MTTKEFFEKQSALTAAKIEIYKNYIEGYLPKLLMQFNICLIADLFCGAGKNGDEDGSPLVLIERAKYILSSSLLQKKQIQILFNDQDENNIQNLREELKKIKHKDNVQIIDTLNEKFEDLFAKLIEQYRNNNNPKFFFLDPFKYSNVQMQHLEQLMALPYTEVLLFLPLFHSYRFASDTSMPENHKTRKFLEQFTVKGVADYQNINTFMDSVKEKIISELSIEFVRPVLLDSGVRKNALFLLTKHQAGMLLMNKVAIKIAEDGSQVSVKHLDHPSLFGVDVTLNFENFKKNLIKELENKGQMTNKEIVDFTIKAEFLPKHGKQVIEELYSKNRVKVYDDNKNEITNKQQWNIAEEIRKKRFFIWQ